MTVESCLKLAKAFENAGESQTSLFYLNRARSKLARHKKYAGLKLEGFELIKDVPKPKPVEKPKETKKNGKKST